MIRSIRSRMLLSYVGMSTIILAASAAGVYVYMSRQLTVERDHVLVSGVKVISQSLAHEVQERAVRTDGEAEFAGLLKSQHHQSFPHLAVGVYRGSRLVARKSADSGLNITEVPAEVSDGIRLDDQNVKGAPARTASVSVKIEGLTYTVIAAETGAATGATLSSLRTALLLLVIAALVLSFAGGYVLARGALKPVTEMASAVDRIDAQSLKARIGTLNPGDELGHLGATFNRLLARLEAAFENERQFVADASHELRTPLSVCLLSAQVALERTRPGEEYRASLATIRAQLERLKRLLNDMLTLARSDADTLAVRKTAADVDEIVLEAVSAVSPLAREKQIRMRVAECGDARAQVNATLLQQLVVILLDNAIKYSAAGSEVTVDLRHSGEEIEIDVRDQGIGIPFEAREKIFERFYRVDPSRSRARADGAGLGLPIAKWIARTHGGSLQLLDSGATGSVFRVRLPAIEAASALV